jgi:hypothetical protein
MRNDLSVAPWRFAILADKLTRRVRPGWEGNMMIIRLLLAATTPHAFTARGDPNGLGSIDFGKGPTYKPRKRKAWPS